MNKKTISPDREKQSKADVKQPAKKIVGPKSKSLSSSNKKETKAVSPRTKPPF